MTSIKGYADLLVLGAAGALNEDQERFLSIIKTNADRLTMLVNDLLDIGRIDTQRVELDLKEIELPKVVQEVIESLRGRAHEKRQTLQADLSPALPMILGDRDRLIQVFTNLIGNAQRYTPTGGRIVVKARPAQVAEKEMGELDQRESGSLQDQSSVWREPEMVRVDIIDDGIGVAPEDRERIFERFFRSDHPLVQETTGTGLGLSITKSLIEMHSGTIWVESTQGKGSVFSFTLPVASKPADQVFIGVVEERAEDAAW
jgi:signal transduction histidine kinase